MMLQSIYSRIFQEEPAPTVVGPYEVVRRLGSGGMGEVYLALNTELERFEALKVVRSSRASDPGDRDRLVNEAKALAQLAHPNVVNVYSGTVTAGNFYLAMEFVPGQTLEVWQKGERRPWRELLEVYVAAGRGLSAVHRAGLVHRDFKPSNVILGEEKGGERRVRVIDFGLATADGGASGSGEPGKFYGTPYFLSPEQCRGEQITAQSDQFSFCVALYEALYKQHPYYVEPPPRASQATTDRGEHQQPTDPAPLARIFEAITSPAVPLREPPRDAEAPRSIFRALARGLERDPQYRYPSLDELLALLARELRPSPAPWLIGMGLAVGAVAGSSIYALAVPYMPGSCENIATALADVWNERREREISSAFQATNASYAEEAAAAVAAAVNGYVGDWQSVHTKACNDAYVSGILDESSYLRQTRCLEAGKRALDATLNAFTTADAETVLHAYTTVKALPPASDCSLLSANVCVTDVLLDQAPQVRDALAEARALEARGQYQAAAEKAEEVVSKAQRANSQPLVAEAAYLQGRLRAELAQWSQARTALATAIAGAEVGGCTTLAIDAMNELARVDGLDTTTSGVSVDFWPVVWAKLDAIGENQLRRARALKNHGLALQRKRTIAQGDEVRRQFNEQAAEQFRQALTVQESIRPAPLDEISTSYRNLGLVTLSLGQRQDALKLLNTGLKRAKAAYGADHPATWRAEFDYAHGLIAAGDSTRAELHLQTGLRLAETAYDRDNIYLGRIHVELARAYDGQYQYSQSLKHAAAGAEIFAEAGLPTHNKHHYAARRALSYAQEMLGEYEQALALRLELARDARQVADDPLEEIVISTIDLGQTYISLGRWSDARRQIELGQAALLPDEVELREELDQLHALALAGQGDPAAVPALRELEKKARELTIGDDVALIDIDTWAHLAFALARATCSEVPPELPVALQSLPKTPRLTALQRAIDLHDPDNCKPLATHPTPKK